MADKSLQERSKRKAVARVDVGVFGIPMRYAAWMRKRRSSWGGLIGISAGQAVAGLAIALLAGMAFGVPANAFSLTLLVCFAIGSAIGGPVSFTLWTVLLIGITHLLAGFIGGAWIAYPSWWHSLAQEWAGKGNVPKWFIIAVPGWILLWIGGSYGVAKLIDKIYDIMSLNISYKAATRFSSEEARIRDEGLAESNVSPVEARSLIDNGSDGTEAIIAGKPRTAEQGVRLAKDPDLGGDPDMPPPSYDNLLEEDMDDPDVRRAMGLTGSPSSAEPAVDPKATAFVIERDEPVQAADPVSLPPELSEPDLPAVPSDNSAPLRRVSPPKIDALASRAMSKKLQQLLTSFEMSLFEDKDEEFIRTNQDELALISEEQKAMLRAMDNSGPLLSAIAAVQRDRASDFLMGKALPPVSEGTGSMQPNAVDEQPAAASGTVSDDIEISDDVADEPSSGVAPAVAADVVPDDGSDTGQVVVADSVAQMGSIFSNLARRNRSPQAVPAEEEGAPAADVSDMPPVVGDVAVECFGQPAAAEPPVAGTDTVDAETYATEVPFSVDAGTATIPATTEATAPSRPVVRSPDVVNGFVIPRPPGEVVVEQAPTPRLPERPQAEDVVPAADGGNDASAAVIDDEVQPEEHAGEISSVGSDGELVVFEIDIEEPAPAAPAEDAAAVLGTEGVEADSEEDEMSSLVFSRTVCRQVIGLITGTLPPFEKANDVLDYERESGFSVAQILNSRSFDEHVGSTEAVAARHTWMDVQRVLSQSSVERLVSDFERLNARGQAMVEEPHTLTPAAFFAFETECTRMLTAASVNDDTISASLKLMDRNRDILTALRDLRDRRESARAQVAPETASTVVRQRIPVGEDVEATRGRGMLATVLGGARKGRDLLRPTEVPPAAVPLEEAIEQDAAANDGATVVQDPAEPVLEEAPVATRVPAYGDEDYVSAHAVGTADFDFDMEMHGHALTARRRIAAAAQDKADREERERNEQAQREENDRQQKAQEVENARLAQVQRDEEERQKVADAAREKERVRLLAGDEAFIKSERARIEAEAIETAARAEIAAADAVAARDRAEREARENARSEEDQAILAEHRARLDGNTLPTRFREGDIPSRFLKLTDLRDQRKKFKLMSMRDKIVGLDGVPEAIASPAKRSSMMMDVMIGAEAMAIYESVLTVLDPENPEDVDAVRAMVAEGEDRRFVASIQDAITTGNASENILKDADAKLIQMRQAVTSLEGVAGISQDLERATDELARAAEREAALRADLVTASQGSEAVAEERDRLKRELETLNRKVSGIVDDDFQRLLEKYAKPFEDAPFDGVFLMMSTNKSHIVMVVTATPDALPGGVVRVGDRSMTLTEVIQIMFDNVKSFRTDSMDAYFTNTSLQSMAQGGTFTTTYSDRSINNFKEMASLVDMTVEPADLEKGE